MPPLRLYTIPSGVPFARALALGLVARYSDTDDPASLARMRVLLPTRRAARALTIALRDEAAARGSATAFLPMIRPLGDVDEEELILTDTKDSASLENEAGTAGALDLPPAIDGLKRRLLLARLIEKWAAELERPDLPEGLGPGQSLALAASLARFLDHLHTENADLSRLKGFIPDHLAAHWQDTGEFLAILGTHWPRILAEQNAMDPAARRSALLDALGRHWQKAPPDTPIIAAGSTGSIPATASLLGIIAGLPNGAVVLPGLDLDLDAESWEAIGPTHPQFGLKHLLHQIGADRGDVELWPEAAQAARVVTGIARRRLLAEALAPAEAAHHWSERAGALATPQAAEGLSLIETEDPAREAGVIALLMRETLETPGRSAALITPDRELARRVTAELKRWRVEVDDSAGIPLPSTPLGIFLRLMIEVVEEGFAPVPLLSLLKHPLCGLGLETGAAQSMAQGFERGLLRGMRPRPGIEGLRARLDAVRAERERRGEDGAGLKSVEILIDRLERAFRPLIKAFGKRAATLPAMAEAHVKAAEALAATTEEPEGAARLWRNGAGETLSRLLTGLIEQGGAFGRTAPAAYGAAFESIMAGQVARPRRRSHTRLFIWGPLEARLQHADVIILGGLNEGVWPMTPQPEPWLNRKMREKIGLSEPERRIGLSAHDFMELASARCVYLTRARKAGGAPQIPSRWLLRLDALLKGAKAQSLIAPEYPYTEWFRALDTSAPRVPAAAPRPTPPFEARPRKLSVTEIETLIRDPYAVYARHVLRLRALDVLDAAPGGAERGMFIHDALKRFVEAYPDTLPADGYEKLLAFGRVALGELMDVAEVESFWWPRFERIAHWMAHEWEPQQRQSAKPAGWEIKGEMAVPVKEPFTLTARADRIDRFSDGSYGVYDYKTGQTPSTKQVESGLSPQIPLEAAMLRGGGFEALDKGPVSKLAYLKLAGTRKIEGERAVAETPSAAIELIDAALAGLARLIARFDDPSTPYLSRPRPMFERDFSDYDHLARVKEWSAGGAEGEGP